MCSLTEPILTIEEVPYGRLTQAVIDSSEFLARAAAREADLACLDDYWRLVFLGRMQVVQLRKHKVVGVILTKIDEYTLGKRLTVAMMGSEKGLMDAHIDQVDQYLEYMGKRYGCSQLSVVGREGWTKYKSRRGYKVLAVTFGKDLA